MAGLMKMMMDQNYAPGWFYLDRQKGVSEAEIKEKIQIEVHNLAINRNYNMEMWTEEFCQKVADLYFNHFSKLYEMSNQKIDKDSFATA